MVTPEYPDIRGVLWRLLYNHTMCQVRFRPVPLWKLTTPLLPPDPLVGWGEDPVSQYASHAALLSLVLAAFISTSSAARNVSVITGQSEEVGQNYQTKCHFVVVVVVVAL